jgi:hypothetical protein
MVSPHASYTGNSKGSPSTAALTAPLLERTLLGTFLSGEKAMEMMREALALGLRPQDFSLSWHVVIYDRMCAVHCIPCIFRKRCHNHLPPPETSAAVTRIATTSVTREDFLLIRKCLPHRDF